MRSLLVVSPQVPYEGVTNAGGLFLLRHLEQLARHTAVTLVAPEEPATVEAAGRAPAWLDVVLVPQHPPRPGSLRHQRDRVEHRLRGAAPLPHVLRALLGGDLPARAAAADLVELHGPEYAHVAPLLRRAGVRTPVVVLEHDVAAQAHTRRVQARGDLVDRAARLLVGRVQARQERRALQAADLLLVFKAADEALLRALGVTTPVRVLDPFLELPSGATAERDPLSVLFTGALWREENDEAVRWLLDQVWPQVLAAVPQARLVLAGDGPTPAARELAAALPGVTVTGALPDLEECYLRAGVFVAPLRTGGGLKFKVPQAMLHGLPVVATTVAAEGVVEVAPEGAFWAVADDPAGVVAALVGALTEPARAAEVGARAAAWCAAHYSFRRCSDLLRQEYARLAAR